MLLSFETFWKIFPYRDSNKYWLSFISMIQVEMNDIKAFEKDGLITIHGSYNNESLLLVSYTERGLSLGEMYDL